MLVLKVRSVDGLFIAMLMVAVTSSSSFSNISPEPLVVPVAKSLVRRFTPVLASTMVYCVIH